MGYFVCDATGRTKARVSSSIFDEIASIKKPTPKINAGEVWYVMDGVSFTFGNAEGLTIIFHPGDFFVRCE